jgi:hypothetical protein
MRQGSSLFIDAFQIYPNMFQQFIAIIGVSCLPQKLPR